MGVFLGDYSIHGKRPSMDEDLAKADSVKQGDMVSWKSGDATSRGKVVRVLYSGTLAVPKTNFTLKGEKDNPAVLIQLYRDGKPTDTQVGHKMKTLSKAVV